MKFRTTATTAIAIEVSAGIGEPEELARAPQLDNK